MSISGSSFKVAGQGYAYPEPESLSPFNDSMLAQINPTTVDFVSFELTGTFKDMGRKLRLTETELVNLIQKVISEQSTPPGPNGSS